MLWPDMDTGDTDRQTDRQTDTDKQADRHSVGVGVFIKYT